MDCTKWEGEREKTRVVGHLGDEQHGSGEDVLVARDGVAVFTSVDEVVKLSFHERDVHALVELGWRRTARIPCPRS